MSIRDYDSPEAVLRLGEYAPELIPILDKIPVIDRSDLAKVRTLAAAKEKAAYDAGPSLGVDDRDILIPARDGHQNSAKLFRKPDTATQGSPLVVLIYGGGFIRGSTLQLAPLARALAATYGATVVAPSYRLAPENPFPTAGNDIRDCLEWVADNAESLGADPAAGFVVGGISAGANLSVTSTHIATEKPLRHRITGLWLMFPVLMSEKHVPEKYKDLWLSMDQCTDSPLFKSGDIDMIKKLYKPDEDSPQWSPYNMPDSFSPSKLPKTYIQVGGLDPLRDDGLMYARSAEDCGLEYRLKVYPGLPHGFIAMPELEGTKQFMKDAVEAVGWMLSDVGSAARD